VLDKHPNDVKLVVKHFPLRSHRYAKKASAAALAANEQGKFWEFHEKLMKNYRSVNGEFHEKLMKNYRSVNDNKILEIAKGLNLDMEQFARDMNSAPVNDILVQDFRDGRKIGIRGIPTVLVNGRIITRLSSKVVDDAIATGLNKGKPK
jgi:protein-disulfide isomerase